MNEWMKERMNNMGNLTPWSTYAVGESLDLFLQLRFSVLDDLLHFALLFVDLFADVVFDRVEFEFPFPDLLVDPFIQNLLNLTRTTLGQGRYQETDEIDTRTAFRNERHLDTDDIYTRTTFRDGRNLETDDI